MRKTYLLISFLCLSSYILGQNVEIVKPFTKNNNDNTIKTFYKKLDSIITKKYNSYSQLFEFDSKNEYLYDSLFRNDIVKVYSWDDSMLNWNYYHLSKLTFNDNSSINEYQYCTYLPNNNQCNKQTMTYYDSGDVDSTYSFHYDANSSQWYGMGIGKQIFNDESLLFSKMNISWMWQTPTDIINGSKHEILYDDNNKEKQTTFFNYNTTSLGWDTLNRVLYDINLNTRESLNYQYDSTTSSWILSGKIVEAYLNDSLVTSIIAYNWINNNWVESNKSINEYDTYNNLIRKTYQTWNQNTSQWDNTTKYELFFDYNYTTSQLLEYIMLSNISIIYLNQSIGFNHKIDYYTMSKWTNNSWFVRDTTVFYYSGQIISIDNYSSNNHFKIYPNPASDYLWLENDHDFKFEIYDINGKLVSSDFIQKTAKLNIYLNNGLYFYRMTTDDTILNGKIIISK